jgi:RNase H-like domain found in reverse transcriptase/Reverse transcriptase (RNA-dependent DNA polymerase)
MKLDIYLGYNNVWIKSGDEWKAVFITKFGLFKPTVIFFGLYNLPAIFQRMMNTILEDMIKEGHVLVYIDDIMIHSPGSLAQHISLVWQVLFRLHKHKLYLKPEKYKFHKKEVEYLGQIVSKGQVAMDPLKTNVVKTWPIPTNKRELQQFLGFCNYYWKFIEAFSKLSNPLQLLVSKNNWNWTNLQQNAFEGLCSKISNEPMLALPNNSNPYKIHSDTLLLASGAVLEQKQEGKWNVIAYTSKSFSPAEWNYNMADWELLAIIHTLKDWYHLLHSSSHKTKIFKSGYHILSTASKPVISPCKMGYLPFWF